MSDHQEPTMTAFEHALLRQAKTIEKKQLILHTLKTALGDIYQSITDCRIVTGDCFGEKLYDKKIFITIEHEAVETAVKLLREQLNLELHISQRRRSFYAAAAKLSMRSELEESLERGRILAEMLAKTQGSDVPPPSKERRKKRWEVIDHDTPIKTLAQELSRMIDEILDIGRCDKCIYEYIADICEALYSHPAACTVDPTATEQTLVDSEPGYCYLGKLRHKDVGEYVVELCSTDAIVLPENHQFVLEHTF